MNDKVKESESSSTHEFTPDQCVHSALFMFSEEPVKQLLHRALELINAPRLTHKPDDVRVLCVAKSVTIHERHASVEYEVQSDPESMSVDYRFDDGGYYVKKEDTENE